MNQPEGLVIPGVRTEGTTRNRKKKTPFGLWGQFATLGAADTDQELMLASQKSAFVGPFSVFRGNSPRSMSVNGGWYASRGPILVTETPAFNPMLPRFSTGGDLIAELPKYLI